MVKKNIIYIKNYSESNNLEYLEENFDICLVCINSIDLIDYDLVDLENFVSKYDIFIIGGGPQHLTSNCFDSHPEIYNQIELIKLIEKTDKLLLGICLGCQIIGLTYGYNIIQMDELCVGFNYLDTNTINLDYIGQSHSRYLCQLNFDLLKKSFSFHYDCIEWNPNNGNLICIGLSTKNIPYVVKHSKSNIYGFQFHPEVTSHCVDYSYIQILDDNNISSYEYFKNNDSDIYLHFFKIFINL